MTSFHHKMFVRKTERRDTADDDTSWVDGSSTGSVTGNIVLQRLK